MRFYSAADLLQKLSHSYVSKAKQCISRYTYSIIRSAKNNILIKCTVENNKIFKYTYILNNYITSRIISTLQKYVFAHC